MPSIGSIIHVKFELLLTSPNSSPNILCSGNLLIICFLTVFSIRESISVTNSYTEATFFLEEKKEQVYADMREGGLLDYTGKLNLVSPKIYALLSNIVAADRNEKTRV